MIKREINYLIKKGLLYTETQLHTAGDNDLIMITIPGMLHLTMLKYVPYLAACSENVYYKNTQIMKAISNRLGNWDYLSKISMVLNAQDMLCYLDSYRQEYFAKPEIYIADGKHGDIFDLGVCKKAVLGWIDNNPEVKKIIEKMSLYNAGTKVTALVFQKQKGSLTCLIDGKDGLKGFLSEYQEKYNLTHDDYQTMKIGDVIQCEIISFDTYHESFQLKYISVCD